jgi:hypothetical protein
VLRSVNGLIVSLTRGDAQTFVKEQRRAVPSWCRHTRPVAAHRTRPIRVAAA